MQIEYVKAGERRRERIYDGLATSHYSFLHNDLELFMFDYFCQRWYFLSNDPYLRIGPSAEICKQFFVIFLQKEED